MLDRYGTYQPSTTTSNVGNHSLYNSNSINHYHVKPNFTAEIPKLIRIPIRIFEKETKVLVDAGAAASLISSSFYFNISDKNIDDPNFRTVSGQELKSLGQYEFKITINKNHLINHNF